MRIQHNIMALNSNRQLGVNNSAVSKSLEKLSSGYRINRAGDDAAGLAISEKMRAQIKGLEAATDNSQDAISLVQTAEGGLQEVHSMLNRMTELATKSANGTYTDDVDRKALQDEVSALKDEINRIADGTDFNGIKLLDGSMSSGTTGASTKVDLSAAGKTNAFNISVSGAGENTTVAFETAAGTGAAADSITASWVGDKLTFTITGKTAAGATFTQADIDKAIADASADAPDKAKNIKVKLDGDIETTDVTGAQTQNAVDQAKTAKPTKASAEDAAKKITVTSNKAGVDTRALAFNTAGSTGVTIAANGNVTIGFEAGKNYTSDDINRMLSGAGVDMTVSFEGTKSGTDLNGANMTLGGGTGLATGGGMKLQIGDTNDEYNQLELGIADMHVDALDLNNVDISTREGAYAAMSKIKTAINTVSTSRGKLGAIQNRLEHTINNLGVTTENITSAESRIRDVDMAKEMMNYTKNSVLVQSAQAMLAQANQQPQSVLQLLQ